MFERFTDRARKVMALANQEAQRFNHEYIGTEHILLGLVKEGSGVGANVLKNLDVDLRKVRLEVEKLVKSGYRTRASKSNAEYVAATLVVEGKPDPIRQEIFYDAQTSGGLLVSLPADRAEALVETARKKGASRACVIGEVIARPRPEVALIVKP